MWEGGGYHPFRLPQLFSVLVKTFWLQWASSSIQLLHVPGELVTQPGNQFGHLGEFQHPSRSFQLRQERDSLLAKTCSTETLAFFFSKHKSPQNLWCGFAFRGHLHLQNAAWMPGLRMNQLGSYPTANFDKQSSVWSEKCWKDRSCQPLSTCIRAVVPLTLEETFYLSTPAASEWRSHVKCEIKMSNAYKREISWESATWE